MTVTETVRSYIVDNFLFGDSRGLRDEVSLLDAGILDSTGVLELVAYLEETFGIKVQDEEVVPENLETIRNIAAFLARKAAGVPGGTVPAPA